MSVRVAVDDERCITSGMCTSIAAEIFEIDDQGKLNVLIADLPPELIEKAESAELCCPTEAISIHREDE